MSFLASLWRQRNYRVAIVVALLALLWLLSGSFSSDPQETEQASAGPGAIQAESLRVQARRIPAQPYATRVLVNGHTEANRSVRLRAELDGAIVGLPVAEGRTVEKGEVICEIDPEDRPEQLARAEASLRKAELDYAGALRLQKKGLQSETDMAQRKVALTNARAELVRAKVNVEKLQIRAPFDGVVNSRAVELGDLIRRGEECATLLDLDPILLVGEVSESQVGSLIPGGPASAQLQQGLQVAGSLRYISQQAHDITRAYRVEVAVDNASGALRAGLSGRLALPTGEITAHRINSSLLTLDDRGDLGVRILDEENRVHFTRVELVGDGDAGVWVSGLPDPVTLITIGQEYVTAGEIVQAVLEQPGADLPAPSETAGEPAVGATPVADRPHSAGEDGQP
ncbi:efflux RND transporter periplasmic adaptor subunit [Microbulbifer taiwanensis]|uniref:Efflux RND transporter periplasmic adaptor subunit n=1 Tax=Microbulbifer taiwanensis TaxID=986746 RepID=A0ABW1YT73_9GAMM|nr:efflux RND transporter periplasmic adaptor subunit [Microbulbifer taiwanensis]